MGDVPPESWCNACGPISFGDNGRSPGVPPTGNDGPEELIFRAVPGHHIADFRFAGVGEGHRVVILSGARRCRSPCKYPFLPPRSVQCSTLCAGRQRQVIHDSS